MSIMASLSSLPCHVSSNSHCRCPPGKYFYVVVCEVIVDEGRHASLRGGVIESHE
jgi:hypothetical protein